MIGSFICPYCKTRNACMCKACINYVKPEDFAVKYTEDGEAMICGNCGIVFSYDQALEEEYKSITNN